MKLRSSSLLRALTVATSVLCAPLGVAQAQTSKSAAAQADELFSRAAALADKGKHAEACPMLEQSMALDPALGTEFNLADCYEQTGQLGRAWFHFQNVVDTAQAAGKLPRLQATQARLAALEPKLAWLQVVVPSGATVSDLRIDRIAIDLPRLAVRHRGAGGPLAKPLAITPGSRQLEATLAGQAPQSHTLEATRGATVRVDLSPKESAASTEPAVLAPAQPTYAPTPAADKAPGRTQRHVGLGLGVAGLASGVAGGVLGAVALSKNSAPSANNCDECWMPFAHASTITFAVGGALLATGAVLWLTAPKAKSEPVHTARGAYVDVSGLHF